MIEDYEVIKNHGTCKNCAFFNDCPIDYKCPPLVILRDILDNEGMYISVAGMICTLRRRNDYDLDDDDTEE